MLVKRGAVLFALALAGAAPPNGEIQDVPPEQAMAILGHTISGPDGNNIGRVVDVLVDGLGQPLAAVIDFGGFMGVGSRKIAVQWSALHFAPASSTRQITLDLTPDQIKAAPEYKDVAKPAPVVTASPAPADATQPEPTPPQR